MIDAEIKIAIEQAIANFEQSSESGAWSSLDKPTVVAGMRTRATNPYKVNQGGQPFCGPASILFEFIRKQPLRYVQICQSLFETGSFETPTSRIEASAKLRQSQGEFRMAQADWMILATLREAENIIFPIDPNAPGLIRNLSGITKSWEMKGWVRDILGYRHVEYVHTYLLGDLKAMRRANQVIQQGGVAFALVTAEGLLTNTAAGHPRNLIAYPNHWITLLGNLKAQPNRVRRKQDSKVQFDVYSWAKKMKVTASKRSFKRFFWGVVIGR
ncbi:MAG: hypothetical protein F6K19_10490 [Cyanothece sp. SIO1E1]|nr:hypothetical protein [Cyanothece sp. SIO1E1]